MSADGEIEIAVKAEGAQDAAAEVADADGGGGGGPGGGGGGLSQGLARGGVIGFALAKLAGPIIDVLEPIQKLLEAFLAPVAVLLLRLLSPALRFVIKYLPLYFRWMETILGVVDFIQETGRQLRQDLGRWLSNLPGWIWDQATSAIGWLSNAPGKFASAIWTEVQKLADMIARKLDEKLSGLFGGGGGTFDTGMNNPTRGSGSRGIGQADPSALTEDSRDVNIGLFGGLDQFVENVERDINFEF